MKISEYGRITEFTNDSMLLSDSTLGTKNILVRDAILAAIDLISPNNHRNIFRGKNIGSIITATQRTNIQNGSFKDLWLGDYWESNGIKWRIVDFDYWYNTGDVAFTSHHLVIMPDASLYNYAMNTTDTTTGGYTSSNLRTAGLEQARSAISSVFGSALLSHREILCNAVSNGIASGNAWYDSDVEIPSEIMMYGHPHFATVADAATIAKSHTVCKTQLAMFRIVPSMIHGVDFDTALRDVVSDTQFAFIDNTGTCDAGKASNSLGVRPVFAIG